jgi:hypothetical protein
MPIRITNVALVNEYLSVNQKIEHALVVGVALSLAKMGAGRLVEFADKSISKKGSHIQER